MNRALENLAAAVKIASISALTLAGGCTGGCSRENPEGPGPEPVSIGDRIKNDPEYAAALKTIEREQGDIAQRGADLRNALEKAMEEGADSETVAQLKAQFESVAAEMDASQKKAASVVRERLVRAQAEQKAYEQKKAQQKKGE